MGCGKTAVAFLAIMGAAGSGYQAAMMLPTEILAAQTQAKLQALIQRMPEDLQPRAAILTGSTRARERREVRQLSPHMHPAQDACMFCQTCQTFAPRLSGAGADNLESPDGHIVSQCLPSNSSLACLATLLADVTV